MWRRNRSCPPVERHSHLVTTGSHSTILRPPMPTNARAAQSRRIGDDVHQRLAAAEVEREDQDDRADADHDELRPGQAEEHATSGESGELHRREFVVVCRCLVAHRSALLAVDLGGDRVRDVRRQRCAGRCGRRLLGGVGLLRMPRHRRPCRYARQRWRLPSPRPHPAATPPAAAPTSGSAATSRGCASSAGRRSRAGRGSGGVR